MGFTRARVLIVDDCTSVRDGIRAFLQNQPELVVCGEAENGLAAIQKARELKPDVIVLDLSLPMLNGVEVSSIIKKELASVKIIAFSMYGDQLGRALQASSGITAALPKSSALAALVETIRHVLKPPSMARSEDEEQPQQTQRIRPN